jgi:hypothetical protein
MELAKRLRSDPASPTSFARMVRVKPKVRTVQEANELMMRDEEQRAHGEVTPCQIKNHVQRKFATPILYAIDILKNYDFFSLHT